MSERREAAHVGERLADTQVMGLRDAVMIAIPAVALLVVVSAPGELRWLRRPRFISGAPRRGVVGALLALLLLAAIFRALA